VYVCGGVPEGVQCESVTWVEKGAVVLIAREARLPEGGGSTGMVGWGVGVGGAGVGVRPGRGVIVGGSEPQASITIRKITIHTRRIDKLYQGSRYQVSGFRCQLRPSGSPASVILRLLSRRISTLAIKLVTTADLRTKKILRQRSLRGCEKISRRLKRRSKIEVSQR
jgi:hypothetical protein